MHRGDYQFDQIQKCLLDLGVKSGDILFIHSNIAFFGRPLTSNRLLTSDTLCHAFYEQIFNVIGPQGTLIVPSYTYSFSNNQVYDANLPSVNMGLFSEWVRLSPLSVRSLDPFYSSSSIGARSHEATSLYSGNSFDEGSLFAWLLHNDAKILNLNLGFGSTFVHYVERCLNVDYRYDLTFTGTIRHRGVDSTVNHTIYVRDLEDPTSEADFTRLRSLLSSHPYGRIEPLGRGFINCISCANLYSVISTLLSQDHRALRVPINE